MRYIYIYKYIYIYIYIFIDSVQLKSREEGKRKKRKTNDIDRIVERKILELNLYINDIRAQDKRIKRRKENHTYVIFFTSFFFFFLFTFYFFTFSRRSIGRSSSNFFGSSRSNLFKFSSGILRGIPKTETASCQFVFLIHLSSFSRFKRLIIINYLVAYALKKIRLLIFFFFFSLLFLRISFFFFF